MSEPLLSEPSPPKPQGIGSGIARLVMAFMLPGSVHFLSGKRLAGIGWFFMFDFLTLAFLTAFLTPGIFFFCLAFVFALLHFPLLGLMFVSSYRQTCRLSWRGWILFLLCVFCVNGLTHTYLPSYQHSKRFLEIFKVAGMAMAPTLIAPSKTYDNPLEIPDRVIVNKVIYRWSSPQRGDIAVYHTTNWDGKPTIWCHRIIGLPGETVDIQSPNILINGKPLTSPPFFETMSKKEDGYNGYVRLEEIGEDNTTVPLPMTLGQDKYFLLGDNSKHSVDSRMKGAASRKDIIGKAVRLYYPFSRFRDL